MTASTFIRWEDKLTRFALMCLLLAVVYGIFAGAAIAMYYDVTPGMGALEDRLAPLQLGPFLLAALGSFFHLPLALADVRHKFWKQAAVRGLTVVGPLGIFLGTEGLIAHALWWSPISDSDRFHLLHHSLVAGAPLTLGYWLLLRRWWRPDTFTRAAPVSPRAWLVSGIVFVLAVLAVGTLAGGASPLVFGAAALIGLVILVVVRRMAG